MPRYVSLHTVACLTRQGAEDLASRLLAASGAITAERVLVNMVEGKMVVEFNAADRTELEKWLADQKIHFDWLMRIEYQSNQGRLVAV